MSPSGFTGVAGSGFVWFTGCDDRFFFFDEPQDIKNIMPRRHDA
jgi:hypothetical protein